MTILNKSDKILFTDVTGFAGKHLFLKLLEHNFDNLVVITEDAMDDPSALSWLPKETTCIQGDLFDRYFLDDVLSGIKYIFHTKSMVSYNNRDKEALYKTNVELTTNLVDTALYNGLSGIVYLGTTASLENNKEGLPISEKNTWQKQKGKSYYSISRFLAELEIWRGVAEGLPALVFAPTNILGHDSNNHVQKYLTNQLASGNYGTPSGSGGFIDQRDLTEFILTYLLSDKSWNEKYILNSNHARYADLLQTMTAISGNEKQIEVRKYLREWFYRLLRPGSSMIKSNALNRTFYKSLETDLVFNTDKAFEAGFAPKYSLEGSLRDVLKAVQLENA